MGPGRQVRQVVLTVALWTMSSSKAVAAEVDVASSEGLWASVAIAILQKNPRAHKNIIGTPPPPPKPKIPPPPLKRGILWTWPLFLQKERIFPGVHKIDAPISGPRIADKNFTDTRLSPRRIEGSFQKSPFSRDSREFRDSRHSRQPPDWKTKENPTIF